MITEQQIRDRIASITSHPVMYAHTREAYVAQLATLIELLGDVAYSLYDCFEKDGDQYVGLTIPIDDEWVWRVNGFAFEILRSL